MVINKILFPKEKNKLITLNVSKEMNKQISFEESVKYHLTHFPFNQENCMNESFLTIKERVQFLVPICSNISRNFPYFEYIWCGNNYRQVPTKMT